MGKLTAFSFMTLNGYIEDSNGSTSWHRHGAEEAEYSAESLRAGNTLLFGRVTYEHMVSFWPTAVASEHYPVVAEGMNKAEKIVFSRTLENVTWNNTKLVKDNMVDEIKKMKQAHKNRTLLGSGSILTQVAEHALIDEYQIMIDPLAFGEGTPLFKGMKAKLELRLIDSRIFKSGVVLLSYQPVN